MKKTTQIGLRIDIELMNRIEKIARYENIDKMSWIRRGLAILLKQDEDQLKQEAIGRYINLTIDEKELKQLLGVNEISEDIKNARKEVLSRMKESAFI
ncbi:MAG: hypothetical protein QW757_03260 [Candidatus Woesearchaeota archaeon]